MFDKWGFEMKVVNMPIEMIAVFNRDGSIKPIRFRLQENHELKVVKIIKIYANHKDKLAGDFICIFTCLVLINDVQRMCEIRYELGSTKWTIFKI
jgi:alpha-glucosidase (family GH31 glycosyl hydrolase)